MDKQVWGSESIISSKHLSLMAFYLNVNSEQNGGIIVDIDKLANTWGEDAMNLRTALILLECWKLITCTQNTDKTYLVIMGNSETALVPISQQALQPVNNTRQFIGAYVKAFQARYGENVRPDLSGKVQGQIKTLLKTTPIERACQLIQVYLQMDTPWFKTKGHDISTFISNLNPIGIALDTGEQQNGINWSKLKKELEL